MTEVAALAAILGDEVEGRFAHDIWATSWWSRTAGEGPDLTGLLTLGDVDQLLADRALRTPFLRVAKDGIVIDPSRYTGGSGVGARVRDQVDADRLMQLLAEGCTVVLQGLHRVWSPLRTFSDTLARELGHPVQVNAYLTPDGAQGFDPHYDTHDVFVVQTAGAKEWRVHEPVVPYPRPTDEWTRHREQVALAGGGEPVLARTLEPGDVIYLPRGWIHAARANAGLSLHLTFGIHPYTRRDLVDALVTEALAGSPVGADALDVSLPLGVDLAAAQGLGSSLEDVRDSLVERIRGVGTGAVATALGRRWAADTRPTPVRPVEQLRAAESLAASAGAATDLVLRSRTGLSLRVEVTADESTLFAGERLLRFSAEHGPALHRIASGSEFRGEDLCGLGPEASAQLMGDLLRAGVVVVAGPPR